jgi:hypothetical protein
MKIYRSVRRHDAIAQPTKEYDGRGNCPPSSLYANYHHQLLLHTTTPIYQPVRRHSDIAQSTNMYDGTGSLSSIVSIRQLASPVATSHTTTTIYQTVRRHCLPNCTASGSSTISHLQLQLQFTNMYGVTKPMHHMST